MCEINQVLHSSLNASVNDSAPAPDQPSDDVHLACRFDTDSHLLADRDGRLFSGHPYFQFDNVIS